MLVNQQHYRTIWQVDAKEDRQKTVAIIDQTQLPHAFVVVEITTLAAMVQAIKTMQVRGAPLIGAAAAYGIALGAQVDATDAGLQDAATRLINSRPTAVNLQWAVHRMLKALLLLPLALRNTNAWLEAAKICDEDVALNYAIGQHGLALIKQYLNQMDIKQQATKRTLNILTHCNAGWLATVDGGTALAPIYAAHDAGIDLHVWVDETRPRNQGASLTAWELAQHGVAHTVISDNAGGHLMQHGQVDMVIVGADRVTATGDICNKIGTYLKALAAHDNKINGQRIGFYAAVPSPTIDWSIDCGLQSIDIEMRDGNELRLMRGVSDDGKMHEINIMLANTPVANPAFDVTPHRFVTGILTEHGLFSPGDLGLLKALLEINS